MINTKQMIERIRTRAKSRADLAGVEIPSIGVVSSWGKGATVDEEKGNNDIIAIANTADIDLDDEVVIPAGLDPSYFKANKQVFLDHEYGTDKAAGFLRSISAYPSTRDHQAWKVRIGLYDNDQGNAVKQIVKASGQIGLSIGFFPTDHGPPTDAERKLYERDGAKLVSVVRAADWFELSFTPLPCNVSCQGQFASGGEKQMRVLRGLVDEGKVDKKIATLFGVDDKFEEIRVLTDAGVVTRRVIVP